MPERDANPEPRLRQATPEDARQIAELGLQLGYAATESQIDERLRTLLPLSQHLILVAEVDGDVLGWIVAEDRLSLEAGRRVEIVGLVVSSQARRRGVGRALVGAVERWQRERGAPTVLVRSNVVRTESHPFYEQLGYERTKTQHSYTKRS